MLRFDPLDERDYGQIVEWIDSPKLLTQWGGTPFSYPLTEDQLREHYETDDERPQRKGFKAVVDGDMVGTIELDRINRRHDSAAISRVFVDPDHRNRGVGKAMVRRTVDWGFDDLGLHRIHLAVFEFNDPAISCYQTVGFVCEGLRRDSHYHDGEYWTTVLMSVLEDEWGRGDDAHVHA